MTAEKIFRNVQIGDKWIEVEEENDTQIVLGVYENGEEYGSKNKTSIIKFDKVNKKVIEQGILDAHNVSYDPENLAKELKYLPSYKPFIKQMKELYWI